VELSDGKPNEVWDITDPGRPLLTGESFLGGVAGKVVLSRDGGRAIVSESTTDPWTRYLDVVDCATGKTIFEADPLTALQWGAGIAQDGATVTIATSSGQLQVWNVNAGELVRDAAGFRPPRIAWHWRPLGILAGAWCVGWGAFALSRWRLRFANLTLIPATVAAFGTMLILLHVVQFSEGPNGDPLSTLQGLFLSELFTGLLFVGASLLTRAWLALAVALLAFMLAFVPTAYQFINVVSSV
jgi:hypothetical protein